MKSSPRHDVMGKGGGATTEAISSAINRPAVLPAGGKRPDGAPGGASGAGECSGC